VNVGDLLAFLRSGGCYNLPSYELSRDVPSLPISHWKILLQKSTLHDYDVAGVSKGGKCSSGSTSLKITLYTQDGLPPSSESPLEDLI